MKLIIYGLAIIGGLTSLSAFAADPSWPKNLVDPHPLSDDFTLPMPCGGAMTFRAIEVPSEGGVLDDIPVQMGQTSTDQGYSNYIHQSPLAAPFSSSKAGVKIYYIGKYDVTRNQYDAIMNNGTCPKPDQAGQKAVNEVSWFDAEDFSKKWSVWLLQNDKNSLPKRDSSYGFVRLPTEAEWYYAAQGGNKVSNTEFLEPTWPMPEGIEQYVMAGSELANGQVQAVGAMKPNPLGLYDMLGEVGQMMQDYYHLNRVGRLHGQAGGIIVKGGNYTFNPSDLNTALREEIPLYDSNSNKPTTLATMGFRVVIAAPTLGSLQETTQAETQFTDLLQKAENVSSDTHQLINNLKNQTTEASTKAGLDRISAQLDSDARARIDAQAATMRAQIEAASALKPDRGKTFICNEVDVLEKWKRNKRDDLAMLRASLFGFIPQTAGLIPFLSIQENILMPQRLIGKKDKDWFLSLVNRLEINSILSHKPHEVSVGQRQRVAVARALINHPLIVLADEPTASVHPSLADGILELLLQTVQETGAALIMTSHDTKRTLQYGLTEVPCELDVQNQITRLSYGI